MLVAAILLTTLVLDRLYFWDLDDNGEPESIILLGDFNIFNTKDATYQALVKNKFVMPELGKTNLGADKNFDQIAFHDPRNLLWPKAKEPKLKESVPGSGVLRFLDSVFRDKDLESYDAEMASTCGEKYLKTANKMSFYKKWRTFQMSDHCPLWVELKIDFSDSFIPVAGGLVAGRGVRAAESNGSKKRVNGLRRKRKK